MSQDEQNFFDKPVEYESRRLYELLESIEYKELQNIINKEGNNENEIQAHYEKYPIRKKFGNILDVPMSDKDDNIIARERALYEYYGLKYNIRYMSGDTHTLIYKMARELKIPGFMNEKEVLKPGKPPKWTGLIATKFLIQVRIIQLEKPNISLRNAIEITRRKYNYEYSLESLYVRYSEIQKNNNDAIIKIMKFFIDALNKNYPIDEQLSILKRFIQTMQFCA